MDWLPLAPIIVGAGLISAWALSKRRDPQVQAGWWPIALIVLRQVLLFVTIGLVLIYPRLIPVIFTGLVAAIAVWWWRSSR